MIREPLHHEESDDGKEHELAQGERDDGSRGELREGARQAHPGEGRTQHQQTKRDRGRSNKACCIEDDCERRVTIGCGGVERRAFNVDEELW